MLFLSAFFQSEELVVRVREVRAEQVCAGGSCSAQASLGYGQSWEEPKGYFNLLFWAKEDLHLKIQRSNRTCGLCLEHRAQKTRLWFTEALWTTWKGSSNHDPESRIKAAAASQCTGSGSGALLLGALRVLQAWPTRLSSHEQGEGMSCARGSPASPTQQMLRLHESLLSEGSCDCGTPRHFSRLLSLLGWEIIQL